MRTASTQHTRTEPGCFFYFFYFRIITCIKYLNLLSLVPYPCACARLLWRPSHSIVGIAVHCIVAIQFAQSRCYRRYLCLSNARHSLQLVCAYAKKSLLIFTYHISCSSRDLCRTWRGTPWIGRPRWYHRSRALECHADDKCYHVAVVWAVFHCGEMLIFAFAIAAVRALRLHVLQKQNRLIIRLGSRRTTMTRWMAFRRPPHCAQFRAFCQQTWSIVAVAKARAARATAAAAVSGYTIWILVGNGDSRTILDIEWSMNWN